MLPCEKGMTTLVERLEVHFESALALTRKQTDQPQSYAFMKKQAVKTDRHHGGWIHTWPCLRLESSQNLFTDSFQYTVVWRRTSNANQATTSNWTVQEMSRHNSIIKSTQWVKLCYNKVLKIGTSLKCNFVRLRMHAWRTQTIPVTCHLLALIPNSSKSIWPF